MKLFRLRGGVHPAANKNTSGCAIAPLPMPRRLYIPLQQHIGAQAAPLVSAGQRVLKGQLLAESQGAISAPVHAPTSGTIIALTTFAAPHPSGLPVRTIVLEADGRDEWIDSTGVEDPFSLSVPDLAERVRAAGIVGMGGATFPAAVKLSFGADHQVSTLIINGGECEPYLTCDDRIMQERAENIIDGVRILMHALRPHRTVVAIEDNKPAAWQAMQQAAGSGELAARFSIEVLRVPSMYPMGSEKQMIQAITGREIPAMKRAVDLGIIVHNVATTLAIHEAVRTGRPLVSRIVTVSGGAVERPMNLEVPFGTLVEDLLRHCGLRSEPARLLTGGPMMGLALPHTRVPVIKGCNGIVALTNSEVHSEMAQPCIRCSRCVSACPIGLLPLEMVSRIKKGNVDAAAEYGLLDCIACGSCSWVCPSRIPLAHYFNYGKGELASRQVQEQRDKATRRLAEAKTARLERIEQEKEQARLKRLAEKQAKEAAESRTSSP